MPLWAAVKLQPRGLKRGGSGAADSYYSPTIFWDRIAGKRPRGGFLGRTDRCRKPTPVCGPGELGDALLQGQHLLVDAHERRAEAAVIGIEYGGGFGRARRMASTGGG